MDSAEPRTIIYDDEEVQVIYRPGTSNYVLITFSDLYTRAGNARFFADVPAVKSNLACIGVVAKRGNWFPKRNLEAAAPIILDQICDYESRILYGGSMGGYAAVKYSALLRATQVIAFCPQWSIDPEECKDIVDPGWQEYFTEPMRGMGITSTDIGGRVFVFADTYHKIDNFHYQMLAKQTSDIDFINVPRVDHHVTTVLAGTKNLVETIGACRAGDVHQLRRIARSARIGSTLRSDKVRAFAQKRFGQAYSMKIASHPTRADASVTNRPRNLVYIASQLAANGRGDRIGAIYNQYVSYINDPIEQLAICSHISLLTSSEVRIKTAHDTFIFYDLHNDICVHGHQQLANWHPVVLSQTGTAVQLFAHIGSAKIRLGIKPDQTIRMLGFNDENCLFDLAAPGHGRFNLSHRGTFVCSDRDSEALKINRGAAQEWEAYSFGLFSALRGEAGP